uniref:Uncharacterized protein n=1 Tax=Leptobrachium leishanense TaxID=445787 RepID=A0A8C5QN79_9ANUR
MVPVSSLSQLYLFVLQYIIFLNSFYSFYQHSDTWTENIRVLNIFTEMFLPHVSLNELERSVFPQILPKAQKLFDGLIYEISRQASSLSSQNVQLKTSLRNNLQTMIQCLKALAACVHHICSQDKLVSLENIQSLPKSLLYVLRAAFAHCKESDSVYCGRLNLVSDLLQAIFKEAVILQKQLMELLDRTDLSSKVSEMETADLVSVLHSVLDICKVVSTMDHALHANTWKFIIKQSLKYRALIQSQLRHSDIINGLCDDITLSFQSCLQLAEHMKSVETPEMTDQKLFQKTVKLCRFFANSLVHYTKDFMPFMSPSCNRLQDLYLQIHSQFHPSLSAKCISDAHKNEISSVFLVAFDPLILQLLPFSPFAESVLNERLDLSPDYTFPKCMLIINIMDKLPSLSEDVILMWCSGNGSEKESKRMSIFRALFQNFTLCYPELAMPLVMQEGLAKGQNGTNVTFYEYVCVRLCVFITTLPPSCFAELERGLLDAVLGFSMLTSLLAMDAWCFMARYGTAELCTHHVKVIACLVKNFPGECHQLSHVTVLLKRLLFLMAADHQVDFVKMFPPQEIENLTIWQHLSLTALQNPLRVQVKNDLFMAAICQYRSWVSAGSTLGDLRQLNNSLSALVTVCNSSDPLDKEQQSLVSEVIGELWPLLNINQILSEPIVQQTFCLIISVSVFTIQTLEAALLMQIVSFLSSLSKESPQSHVQLAMLEFLSALGKIFVPHEVQPAVFSKIASLFSLLLSDKSWIVKHHALEAFTRFAEETNHEDVVRQSLNTEELKNLVVSFLNKIVTTEEPETAKFERLKNEKHMLDAFFAERTARRVEASSVEPSAKRARLSETIAEQFSAHANSVEKALANMRSLLQDSPAPEWLPEKLQNIQAILAALQESCPPKNLT